MNIPYLRILLGLLISALISSHFYTIPLFFFFFFLRRCAPREPFHSPHMYLHHAYHHTLVTRLPLCWRQLAYIIIDNVLLTKGFTIYTYTRHR